MVSTSGISANLIKELKLGKIISSLKEKLDKLISDSSNNEKVIAVSQALSSSCKEVLLSWKRMIESKKKEEESLPAALATDHIDVAAKSAEAVSADYKPSLPDTISSESKKEAKKSQSSQLANAMSELPANRRQVLVVLSNALKLTAKDSTASDSAAIRVEEAISTHNSNEKNYLAKAKTLLFNLKKNEVRLFISHQVISDHFERVSSSQSLRKAVMSGAIPAEELVSMSAAQLATTTLAQERARISEDSVEGRRTDWFETNKQVIDAQIGIDPNKQWDYDDADDRMSEPDTDPPDI